jgi:hypothetical protein
MPYKVNGEKGESCKIQKWTRVHGLAFLNLQGLGKQVCVLL